MSHDEIRLILMTVSATVAITALFLTIRNRIIDKKKDIRITYTTLAKINGLTGDYIGSVFSVYLTNTGNVPLFIYRPYVKTPFKKDGFDKFELLNVNDKKNYPLKLEPGAEHVIEFGIKEFMDSFNYIKWYRRISFEVRDTVGNVYSSKKIFYKKLIAQSDLAKQIV